MEIHKTFTQQKQFFLNGETRDLNFRKAQLRELKAVLKENQEYLSQAIYEDFDKSAFETHLTEFALVYHSIDEALKNLNYWSAPQKVPVSLANFPAKAFRLPEPLGVSLIIGAWNYPYQLTLAPLVAAMAAGNTGIIKPSELPSKTAQALAEVLNKSFSEEYISVINGGAETTQELLQLPFDKIFFTGSTKVGKIVAKAAAENLTPTTLELGGKSPCFVFKDADLTLAARRIAWGKFLNAGQTCVAPDYLLIDDEIYDRFLEELKKQLPSIVGVNPKTSESYVKIISEIHTTRLMNLIPSDKVYYGGKGNIEDRYIEPTILKDIEWTDELMQEEIFGPLLPCLRLKNLDDSIKEIQSFEKPLSLYVFTRNQNLQNKILSNLSFGGGCINDTVMHLSESHLPFGGVGKSGWGSYHGKAGFDAFTHYKSILHKGFFPEPPIKYQPYTNWKRKILDFLFG